MLTSILLPFLQPEPPGSLGKPSALPQPHTHVQGQILCPEPLSWSGVHSIDQRSAWLSNCLRTQNIPDQLAHDSSAKNQQLLRLTGPGKAVDATNWESGPLGWGFGGSTCSARRPRSRADARPRPSPCGRAGPPSRQWPRSHLASTDLSARACGNTAGLSEMLSSCK